MDQNLISSIFSMSILQTLHLGIVFNVYSIIFGKVEIKNIYIVAIVVTIILASINAIVIQKKGFHSIEKCFLKTSKKERLSRDIVSIAFIVLTIIVFDITL